MSETAERLMDRVEANMRTPDTGASIFATLRPRPTLSGAEAEAEGWFRGPPYAVVESVFDENDIEGCAPGPGGEDA